MPTPISKAAYKVYYDVLDRALDSPNGIRIEVGDKGAAFQYRVRLHAARAHDRELNRESREPHDPEYGISDYDNLVVRLRSEGDKWWVYVEHDTLPKNIEELNNEEADSEPHLHSDPLASGPVPVHNLRGDMQPEEAKLDDPPLPNLRSWTPRGF